MKKYLFVLVVICLSMVACGPSEEEINRMLNQTMQAIIKETVLAKPIYTETLNPTLTLTRTLVPTSTITPTITATLTSTPDIRVIKNDPRDFLLEKVDLPMEAKYYLPNAGWMSINTNEEVISARGVEIGRDYVISTGRETGWWVAYQIGVRDKRLPEEIFCFVGRFSSAEGAQLALTEYGPPEYLKEEGWEYIDYAGNLGEVSHAYTREEITSGGDTLVWHNIEFTYYNFLVNIEGYGYENDVSFDFLVEIGNIVLEKIKQAELFYPD